jgi:hypothetical protein
MRDVKSEDLGYLLIMCNIEEEEFTKILRGKLDCVSQSIKDITSSNSMLFEDADVKFFLRDAAARNLLPRKIGRQA